MPERINDDRRRFLGGAAMTLLSANLGFLGAKAHAAAASRLPVEGNLPSFDGGLGWLNSQPLTAVACVARLP